MLQTAYYLIRPSSPLRDHLTSKSSDYVDILLRPVLLSNGETDRSAWGEEDHAARIKLVFLAYLWHEYSRDPEFQQLLMGFSIGLETFDRWWILERHLLEGSAEALEKGIDSQTVERMRLTALPLVDRWASDLRHHAPPSLEPEDK
jgi:hypothetical protein